jgi:hypothetical protein
MRSSNPMVFQTVAGMPRTPVPPDRNPAPHLVDTALLHQGSLVRMAVQGPLLGINIGLDVLPGKVVAGLRHSDLPCPLVLSAGSREIITTPLPTSQ